jgi:hypothetical protein
VCAISWCLPRVFGQYTDWYAGTGRLVHGVGRLAR